MGADLASIVRWVKGHDCERTIRRTAQEIEISGAGFGAGDIRVDVGKFSNKVKQLVPATKLAAALDGSQYLLCTTAAGMSKSDPLRNSIERMRVSIIYAFTQLQGIMAILEVTVTEELTRKLEEWVAYTNDLMRHAISVTIPTTRGHAGAIIPGVEMFCVKCKEKRTVTEDTVTREKTAKGRNMIRAACPICETKMVKFWRQGERPQRLWSPAMSMSSSDLDLLHGTTRPKRSLTQIMRYQGIKRNELDKLLKAKERKRKMK